MGTVCQWHCLSQPNTFLNEILSLFFALLLTTSFSFLGSDSFYRRDCRDGDRNISLVPFFLHPQYVACQNFPFSNIFFFGSNFECQATKEKRNRKTFRLSGECIEVDFKEVTLSLQGVRAKFISAKKNPSHFWEHGDFPH